MDIKNIATNFQKIAFQAKPSMQRAFLTQPEDTATFSRKPLNEASAEVQAMKDKDGKPRFNAKDIKSFNTAYEAGVIDMETINTFKDNTKFNMKSMIALFETKKDSKTENLYDTVTKIVEDAGKNNQEVTKFDQSIFEPKKEFTITTTQNRPAIDESKSIEDKIKDLLDLLEKKTVGTCETTYNTDGEKVQQKTSTIDEMTLKNGEKTIGTIIKTIDFKNNTVSEKLEASINKSFEVVSHTLTKNDKNGKMLRKEEMTQSEIPGVYDIKYTYPNGKTKQVSKATVDAKTGIKTIKKDMKSEDGTRTEFLYEDDPNGNRIVDYKITDKNGKILMKNSQSFEVINDNKFISSKNGYKYEITTDDKSLTVKHLGLDKEAKIDFKKNCKGNVEELTKLLKKVPGEELFEAVDCIKKMNGKDKDKLLDSYFSPVGKKINIGDDLFVFLHELGHAKDAEANKSSLFSVLFGDNKRRYDDDPDIRKTFLAERETFNKYHSDAERDMVDYFTQAKGHYQGEWGGLAEVIAETNALTNTYAGDKVTCLGARSQLLQQHFPKTIASIRNAMEWKNDLNAIEYYGT